MKTFASIVLSLLVLGAGRSAAAVEILHDTVKGDNASVSFSRDTIIDCGDGSEGNAHLDVLVVVNEVVQRGDFNNQVRNDVNVFAFIENTCTGEASTGRGEIQDPDFRISAQQTAHLTGTVGVFDVFSGALLGETSFDLAFAGVGTRTHTQFHQRLDLGTLTVIQHSIGAFRDAAVTGTFTFDGVELIDSASGGRLGKSRAGTILMFSE